MSLLNLESGFGKLHWGKRGTSKVRGCMVEFWLMVAQVC